ncbi:MAG: UDP-N-acetylmuramoyl-L-alanine--D-glutamate ligase [Patescibacteria group bacterium]
MNFHITKPDDVQDKNILILGLGLYQKGSGISATKWFMRHGAKVTITDLKSEVELKTSVNEVLAHFDKYSQEITDRTIHKPIYILGEHRQVDVESADMIIRNPGVPKESEFLQYAHKKGIAVESDVSLFFHFCPFPIYAVTGTRGKSTTTALIGEMLKKINSRTVIAGNIQHSPLEDLDWLMLESAPVPIVLELSSWLIETLEHVGKAPQIAVMTNLYEDHLNRYASFDDYADAKKSIFTKQSPEQFAVLNANQERVRMIASQIRSKPLFVQTNSEMQMIEFETIQGEKIQICSIAEMAMKGAHNVENAIAASIVGYLAGVPVGAIASVLKTFKGLENRQEIVGESNGITFVNDTTATSPDGAIAALNRFANGKNIVLICGGASKGLSHNEMGAKIRDVCKAVVYLQGNATDQLMTVVGSSVKSEQVGLMQDAVSAALDFASAGDVVLLSPGAASFGMFINEFDRGAQFKKEVKKRIG